MKKVLTILQNWRIASVVCCSPCSSKMVNNATNNAVTQDNVFGKMSPRHDIVTVCMVYLMNVKGGPTLYNSVKPLSTLRSTVSRLPPSTPTLAKLSL